MQTAKEDTPLLQVEALTVDLGRDAGTVRVVDGLSFRIEAGRTLGMVGESGCGKSMTALALMGIAPSPHRLGGSIRLSGEEISKLKEPAYRRLRGKRMAMIFQEPISALNPVMPVGIQVAEMLVVHEELSAKQAGREAVALLDRVGIAPAGERARAYPHELSGGMRQRVMIAIAIACRPDLLIADEPTTALDVSVQAQILDLLLELQQEGGMAMLFISHNLGVVSEVSDEIIVMYAGRAVEHGPSQSVLQQPMHPYTAGLIATIPDVGHRKSVLPVIAGRVPDLRFRAYGCAFHPRCLRASPICTTARPDLSVSQHDHAVACHHPISAAR